MNRTPLVDLVALGLSDAEIADRLGVSARTVLRWRTNAGITSQWIRPLPPHGERSRYVHHHCHCDACRAANTAYSALTRATRSRARRARQEAATT